jgi:hypothetical protein
VRLGPAKDSSGNLRIGIAGQHEHAFPAVELGACDFPGLHFALIDADRYDPASNRLSDA